MRLIGLPGVFRPRSDTWMLARELVAELAARVSRRSVATVLLNARLRGVRVRALRGSLFDPVEGRQFDLIATNPPYVPATGDTLPTRDPERAWDAGLDGRALIDPICDDAAAHLRPGGVLLMIHSSLCGGRRKRSRGLLRLGWRWTCPSARAAHSAR